MNRLHGQFYDVHITRAANDGYIIQVGCQNFICPKDKVAEACNKLREYLENPDSAIKQFTPSIQSIREAEIGEAQASASPGIHIQH